MDRKLLIITGSVVTAHLFFFFFHFNEEKKAPPPKKSIIVHTYAPPPPPVQQKIITKQSIKKTETVQLRPSPNGKKKEILKELKEALEKIETKEKEEKEFTLTLPKNIQSLQIDHVEKTAYSTLLAHALKQELELPERGVVKLELTISRTGKVIKLKVLDAMSELNQRYLEKRIPKLSLPPFNEDLKNEKEHRFTLTFCNET